MVGTFVTNPVSRDPSVTASTFATLNDTFGNRTICGIGRGDSVVLGPRPQADHAPAARRGHARHQGVGRGTGGRLLRRQGQYSLGQRRKARRVDGGLRTQGPQPNRRKADGFILQLADPVILDWTMQHVHDAARDAGRDPKSVKVCVAPAYVGEDLTHQRDQCRWFGGMVGNHVADLVARYGEDSQVPHALTDYIKAREVTTTVITAKRTTP